MRRKVLQATISAVAVAVLLLGFPLAYLGAMYVGDNEQGELTARTDSLARAVDARIENGEPIPQSTVDNAADASGRLPASILVIDPDGNRISGGEPIDGDTVSDSRRTDAGAFITVNVSSLQIALREAQVVALVVVASFVAFVAGISVAVWQANRLAAPLVYLAASAEQLGSGQVRPQLEPSGVEEIDLVASELARTADRMAVRLAAERQFASDASHQLRTPLTALTMRLEDITMASDDEAPVREEARISLEQVERLVGVVDDLLRQSRQAQGGTTEPVALIDVVRQLEEEWIPTFAKAQRSLVIDVPQGEQVLATPGGLAQVLATLVENSLKHGGGTTTIRSRPSGPGGAVVIEVADEGDGVPEDLAPHIFERSVTSGAGTGLGLALARDLAAADGGRLKLSQRTPAVFSYFLAGVPRTLDATAVLPQGRAVSSTGGRKGWVLGARDRAARACCGQLGSSPVADSRVPVVAVVGGGQLARMMAPAAGELGVHLRVLVEERGGSADQVVSDAPVGAASDEAAVRGAVAPADGARADVLTFEHEHVPNALLAALVGEGTPVHPGPEALVHAQDKIVMRERLTALGAPCPRWAALPEDPAQGREALAAFLDEVGGEAVVKTSRGGYDGKVRVVRTVDGGADQVAAWFDGVVDGGPPLLVEEKVPFVRELAVLVARRPSGEVRTWPVVESVQRDGVCSEVVAPAPGLSTGDAERARQVAVAIAEGLGVTGVLAVEMFEVAEAEGGTRLLNELAMRPHNSGHWTIDGAVTSQFEQHLRAVLDLPLGDTRARAPWTVMANVLGSSLGDLTEALPAVLGAFPDARVNLYGKSVRPGRKLGHVNVSGDDLDEVRRRALAAAALLRGETVETPPREAS